MGSEFIGFVEVIRHFGWAAIGIHFVFSYAVPLVLLLAFFHLSAFSLKGRVRRVCRSVALAMSCVLGAVFLVLVCVNPALGNVLKLACAAYFLVRNMTLLRREKGRESVIPPKNG